MKKPSKAFKVGRKFTVTIEDEMMFFTPSGGSPFTMHAPHPTMARELLLSIKQKKIRVID